MKKTIMALLALGTINASAMDIYCETGLSGDIKKITLTRATQVIKKIGDDVVVKAEINDYNLASVTVESSDKYYFGKNIAQAQTIIGEDSASFVALNYLRSADDDQQQVGGAVCGSSEKRVLELREYMNKQGDKLGSEVN